MGLRRAGLAVVAVLAVVLAGAAGFFAFLHMPPGERWLAARAERAVAGLTLDGFTLGWPFRMRADHLRVADADGVWLDAEAIELVWHPLRLWGRVLDIDRLMARRVDVLRLPQGGEGGGGLSLPDSLRLDEVRLPVFLAAPVLGQPVGLELAGTIRMEGGGGPVEMALRAQGGGFIRATGIAGTDYLDLRWYLDLPELGRWQQLAGLPLAGAVSGSGVVAGRLPSPEISGRFDSGGGRAGPVGWRAMAMDMKLVPALPWLRLSATADMTAPTLDGRPLPAARAQAVLVGDLMAADGHVRLDHARLSTPDLTAQAAGVVDGWGRRTVLRVTARTGLAGGTVAARGVVAGDLTRGRMDAMVAVRARALSTGSSVADRLLGPAPQARLRVAVRDGRVWLGPSRLTGAQAGLSATGAVWPYLGLWARLDLPRAEALAPGLTGTAAVFAHGGGPIAAPALAGVAVLNGIAATGAPPASGVVGFDLPQPLVPRGHLSAALDLAGTPVTGQARLDRGQGVRLDDVQLSSGLGQVRGGLEFVGGAQGNGVRGRLTGTIPELRQWQAVTGLPLSGSIDAEAEFDPADGQTLRLRARADTLNLNGTALSGAILAVEARGLSGDTRRFQMTQAQATVDGIPVRLAAPAMLWWRGTDLRLADTRLAVADGAIDMGGQVQKGDMALHARLTALPLAVTGTGAVGRVDGSVTADGPMAAPRLRFALTGSDLGLARPDAAGLGTLQGRVDGTWQDGLLRGRGEMRHGRALAATAEGSIAVPGDGALDLRLNARGDTEALAAALPMGGHVVTGHLEAAASISGTLASPRVDGHAVLRGGRYENLDSGTIVSPLRAEALLNGERITLTASGGDGGDGRVRVEGTATLAGEIQAQAVLDDFTALRRDDGEASVSGTLALTDGRLTGAVTVPRAEVDVGRLRGQGPVHLDVIEINRPAPPPSSPRDRRPAGPAPPPLALAVHVQIEHAFVRGRGLDSEWQGAVDAGGTVAQPTLSGRLTAARGQYDLLGKSFRLTPDSAVIFVGGDRIDPALDITAETAAADITAQVRVTGTATAPETAFTSTPPLPQDEVLARVLFGREAGKLSAYQQIQLAQLAAGGLTGGGGGIDPLGTVRGFLGLDVLGVGSETDRTGKESPTLSAGRYVGRDTFVRVDQGTAGLGKVTVEQSLGGGFSLESSVGEQSGGGLGVTWRKDY